MKYLLPFLAFLVIISGCNSSPDTSIIFGKVIDRESDTVIIANPLEDPRFAKIEVPIIDGIFTYTCDAAYPQAWWIIFQDEIESGGFRPILFFPDQDTVSLSLNNQEKFDNNSIKGGMLNKEYALFNSKMKDEFSPRMDPISDSINMLFKTDSYHSEKMKMLYTELRASESQDENIVIYKKMSELRASGDDCSKLAKEQNDLSSAILTDMFKWKYQYYEDNPTVVSYYMLLSEMLMLSDQSDKSRINNLVKVFVKEFPDHPYTQIASNLLTGIEDIKVGGKYVDFTLPDLEGNEIVLSEYINNKIALIDLWATWCGPCIAKARSMKPVYEEFKDRGFTIIGVAAEIDNTDRLLSRLEKEQFPWLNLLELDHKNGIWQKYGCANAGGLTFLVDKDGTILAIGPDADEVRSILTEKLSE